MVEAIFAVVWFGVAAVTSLLSVAWQEARERRQAGRAAMLDGVLEAVTWAPIVLVVAGYWSVIGACILGSMFGSWWGVRRLAKAERCGDE